MGYLRYLDEDKERHKENERVQRLEMEKMKREAEALARLAEERKKARLLLQRQQQEKEQAGEGGVAKAAARTLSKSAVPATEAAPAAAVRPVSVLALPGAPTPRVVPMVQTSIRARLSEAIKHADMVQAFEEAQAMAAATAGSQ